MKKLLLIAGLCGFIFACGNEPELSNQEEVAIEDQLLKDQAAMDSLEKVIQAQIDESEIDSIEP